MLDLLGLSNQSKMLVRLYALPAILMLFYFFLLTQADTAQDIAKTKNLLRVVSSFISNGLWWGSLISLGASTILFLYATFRLWQWGKGADVETCHSCGCMVSHKNGRYGPYYKCLACGSNKSTSI